MWKKISLSNIDVEVWYKFNKYDLSKFTKERIEEYEVILYEAIQYMQNYFNKKIYHGLKRKKIIKIK